MHADGRNTGDRRADVTKITGAFRECANEPCVWSDILRRMN